MALHGIWVTDPVAYGMMLANRTPVHKINAFEAKDSIFPFGHTELKVCNKRNPFRRPLFIFYAKMGLHRYNLIEGKNYQFSAVEKCNYTTLFGPNNFYITLTAIDPANGSTQSIHAKVNEHTLGKFDLTCDIAVPRGDPNIYPHPKISSFLYDHGKSFPKWPLENPFNSPKRFYLVKKSELQDNEWIRLYLELTVATNLRMYNKDGDLSTLEILEVAIEPSSQDPNKGCLNAKNITVYISYRDTSEARVGKDVDRIAMVRRSYDEQWKCFCLVGHNQSWETIPKSSDEQSECFSLVGQNQSSETTLKRSDEQSGCLSLAGHNQSSETLTKKSRKNAF